MEKLQALSPLLKAALILGVTLIANPLFFWALVELDYRTRSWAPMWLKVALIALVLISELILYWQILQLSLPAKLAICVLVIAATWPIFFVTLYIASQGGWRGVPAG